MMKKIIKIILISLILLIPACDNGNSIRDVYVPKIKLEISDNPNEDGYQPWVFSGRDIDNWLNNQIELVGAYPTLSPLLDDEYFVWDYKNAILFLKEYRKEVWNIQFKFTSRDCDDYAFNFKTWVQFNYANTYNIDAAVPIAVIFVRQVHEFGGVPAGGGHALIGVATNNGVLIYEPQSGVYTDLKNYPNAEYIYYILR